MPNLIVGGVPRGKDYFGQEEFIEKLWAKLECNNILLEAPRRFGKTGAMFRLMDEPRDKFNPIYIDVEHIMSAADFMVEITAVLLRDHQFGRAIRALWEGTKGFGLFLRNLPASIDIGELKVELREQTDVPQQWEVYGERIMSLLAKGKPPLLLLIDEFAIMIDNIAQHDSGEVKHLLRWFRAARLAPGTQTRFVLGGSVNLVYTLDSMGLVDTINDFYIERLKPFDRETAGRFIAALFSSQKIALLPETSDTILELLGKPIPYFLSVLLTAIFDRHRAIDGSITKETVKTAFEEDLLGGATSAVFQHYRSRISQYYPGREGQAANAILGALSKSEIPVKQETIYQIFLQACKLAHDNQSREEFLRLMHKLDNDFYIEYKNHSYSFFSKVLQLWWKAHYGFQEY